ncbi:Lrp/AsnC family transcriptional regulator [Leucobacter soli]|uniref:Lrp/AsnC family transcriptional regulator n=1 Tax=Leucobacter soli TaxID=2812850 RepID=UPI003612B652
MTFDSLAAELGISETMVRKRYTALTRAGAMRVIAIANPLHLGYAATGWLAITCSASGSIGDIAEELTRIDEVSYVAITAGSYDIVVEVVCKTHEDLLSLIDSRVRPIAGIERTEMWLYLDLEYKALLPLQPPGAGRPTPGP